MLSLAGDHDVHLRPARLQRAQSPLRTKQQQFGDISEVESHASSVRSAILANLVPNDVGLVIETPDFHDRQRFEEKRVWAPQVQVTFLGGKFLDWQRRNFLKTHGRVSV